MTRVSAVTGDGSTVGLFIRLPKEIADQFPKLEEDSSPSHVTFLYVGEVGKDREEEFLEIVGDVVGGSVTEPVAGRLDNLDYFQHAAKDQSVAHVAHRFDRDLKKIRGKLVNDLMAAGFELADFSPQVWRPHTTLGYQNGVNTQWEEDVPTGKYVFDTIEVWGLSKKHEIPIVREVAGIIMPPDDTKITARVAKNHMYRLSQDPPEVAFSVDREALEDIRERANMVEMWDAGYESASNWAASGNRKLTREAELDDLMIWAIDRDQRVSDLGPEGSSPDWYDKARKFNEGARAFLGW